MSRYTQTELNLIIYTRVDGRSISFSTKSFNPVLIGKKNAFNKMPKLKFLDLIKVTSYF